MNHDSHFGFVIAAYALAFFIVAGMVVTILADYLNLKQALSSFALRERQQAGKESKGRDINPQSPDPESST
ncbi:MAG TPA: heme exporter protein CcmD [Methylocella sp.]|nr:heme exporter protein CcmD [Methylocella sp.]